MEPIADRPAGPPGREPNPSNDYARWQLLGSLILLTASYGPADGDGFAVIRQRQVNQDRVGDETVAELLDPSLAEGSVVVEGAVVDVEDGVGMRWTFTDDGEEERHVLAFADGSSLIRRCT